MHLRPLLKDLGFHLPIEGDVTFVNPNFTLYQAPLKEPIIHPTQLNSLMKRLNEIPSKLTNRHKTLADQLISLHQTDNPFTRFPPYNFGHLKKGIICGMPLADHFWWREDDDCLWYMRAHGKSRFCCLTVCGGIGVAFSWYQNYN